MADAVQQQQQPAVATTADNRKICPVVGTYADSLPLAHPPVDLSVPGQTCPVVGAKTQHHVGVLHAHPPVDGGAASGDPANATACPVLSKMVGEASAKKLDEELCPVVGTATTVLPPGHPTPDPEVPDAVCPVTKASVGHHMGKVSVHPDVGAASTGATCPVVGLKA